MVTALSNSVSFRDHPSLQVLNQSDDEIKKLEEEIPPLEVKKARAEANGDLGRAGEIRGDIAGIRNTIEYLKEKNKGADMQSAPTNASDGHMQNTTAPTPNATAHLSFLSRFHLQAVEDVTTPISVAAQTHTTAIKNLAKDAWQTMNTSAFSSGHIDGELLAKQTALVVGGAAIGVAVALACGVSAPTIATGAAVGAIGLLARSVF